MPMAGFDDGAVNQYRLNGSKWQFVCKVFREFAVRICLASCEEGAVQSAHCVGLLVAANWDAHIQLEHVMPSKMLLCP